MNELMPGRRIGKDFIQGWVERDAQRQTYFRVNYELVEGRWEGFVSIATEGEYITEQREKASKN
jgi:hypothetical protein